MKRGIDPSILIGLAIGVGGIMTGFILEGGRPGMLWGLSAFIIIVAGTSGAAIVSFGLSTFLKIGTYFQQAMQAARGADVGLAEKILEFAERARKEGLLSLEDVIDDIDDPLLKKGLRLVVDGVDPDEINSILQSEIDLFEHEEKEKAEFFGQIGGFLPTMGIIGTVTGLILVLAFLGEDTSHLGHAIAVAFVATLYGISFANLFALPIANKIKTKMKEEKIRMEMLITGVFAIHRGESPMLIEEKLNVYLGDKKVTRGEAG